jgi:hypothetical protein
MARVGLLQAGFRVSSSGGGGGGGGITPPPGAYPGQAGNLVGYNNAPSGAPAAFSSAGGKVWPGAYSSLAAWPGGAGNLSISSGSFASSGSGTAADPWVFAFYDFNLGTGGVSINVANCIFVGCRFQSNDSANYNVQTTALNIAFIYCSFVPPISLYTTPPGAAWPSAGTGLNTTTQVTGVNCIDGNSGYQYGISINGGGNITADHCDCWGMGNDFLQVITSTGFVTCSDCWVHDAANAAPQTYHQDGIGYVNGGAAPPGPFTVNHCTIASIGNTNGIAFQAATTPYNGYTITNNYFSGFGFFGDFGHDIAGNSNWTVTDNVFATDVQWVFGPLYSGSLIFLPTNTNNNVWQRNTLKVYPGSAPGSQATFSFSAVDDGKFLWPDSTVKTTDWNASSGGTGGTTGAVPMPSLTSGTGFALRPVYSAPNLTWEGPVGGGPSTGTYTSQTQSLTTVSAVTTSSAGQVIENKYITGNPAIQVNHNNVTIRRCFLQSTPANTDSSVTVNIANGVTGTIVEDCYLDGNGTSNDCNGVSNNVNWAIDHVTVRRCHFYRYGQCIRFTLTNVSFLENYCEYIAGPDQDYVECYPNGGIVNNLTIQYNYFTGPDNAVNGGDSALNFTTGSGLPVGNIGPNINVDHNWMVRTETTQSDAWQYHYIVTDRSSGGSLEITVTNNGFYSGKSGATWFDASSSSATTGSGLIHHSGNYVMSSPTSSTGTAID